MKPSVPKLAPAVALLASAAPLFALTVHGWTNAMLFLAAALSLALLAMRALPAAPRESRGPVAWVVVAFAAPLVATALSAALRGDPYPPQFDAPLRQALAIPVFLVVLRCGLEPARLLRWTVPLALVLVAAHRLWFGQPAQWPADRVTTAFVDPLVFGYLSIAFALMALMSISLRPGDRSSRGHVAVACVGVALGLALSVLSGSRSGWVAIPVVAAVWLHMNVPAIERRGKAVLPLVVVFAAVVIGAGAYEAVPKVHQRIHEAVDDVTSYSFGGKAPETPVGLRITFLRIAGDLIAQHPLAGVGDTAHRPPAPPSQFPYATLPAVHTAFSSAFHNQVVTDTVRHGIAGGIAAALLLFVPLVVYSRRLRPGNSAALGLAYSVCIVVASFTTEVVDLKYTASLYALVTAVLCGASLARHGQD